MKTYPSKAMMKVFIVISLLDYSSEETDIGQVICQLFSDFFILYLLYKYLGQTNSELQTVLNTHRLRREFWYCHNRCLSSWEDTKIFVSWTTFRYPPRLILPTSPLLPNLTSGLKNKSSSNLASHFWKVKVWILFGESLYFSTIQNSDQKFEAV